MVEKIGSAAMFPGAGSGFEGLIASLLRDLLPLVRADELAAAFLHPARVGLQGLACRREERTPPWEGASLADLPASAWRHVRAAFPEAAVYPLGPVAERALKRLLARREAPQSPARALHDYTTLWLFEAAMLDLRGSAEQPEQDYGFWYHWKPDGEPRTLDEERELRREVHRGCRTWASRLLGVWARRAGGGDVLGHPREVLPAFQEVFQTGVRRPLVRTPSGRHPLTVVALPRGSLHMPAPAELAAGARHVFIQGEGANVQLDSRQLLEACGGRLHPLLADLLDVAATVYVADVHLPRTEVLGRDLTFQMAVRHPEVWSRCAEALARPVSFLSGNFVDFRFVPLGEGGREPVPDLHASAGGERCACLLSGGLDSFAGAARLLGEPGRRPLLVSHDPSPGVRGTQQALIRALAGAHPDLQSILVPVKPAVAGVPASNRLGQAPPQVLYQYARSFLFLSLATCAAVGNGFADLYVFENGPVALNPSFSEARFNTRTAHRVFLDLFRDLVREALGVELRIHTPFALQTKGEVLAGLDPRWHASLRRTNSCWSASKVKAWAKQLEAGGFEGSHCGRCLPCAWRRAAVLAAGLTEQDDAYLWDAVPPESWSRWLGRTHSTVLLDQLRFCRHAVAGQPAEILDLCPDFYEGDGTVEERIALYRRFSREMIAWYGTVAGRLSA